jgi:hypothetical protein
MYSQYIFNFEAKNEPQYIVPALFFPDEINQLNIAPFYWQWNKCALAKILGSII